jgi:uncharacterized membrane protein
MRVGAAVPIGAAAAVAAGALVGWQFAPAAGWIAAAAVYLVWTWVVVSRMDEQRTASHATREDPTRVATDVIVLTASVASLAGVGYLLVAGSAKGVQADAASAVGIGSVAAAWLVVHTLFTLRYAQLYYLGDVGGVDFNQPDYQPTYRDFAYLAFTIGMTYQVSDTELRTRAIRATALRHALLSYLLGAIVLAVTINLIAGLGKPSS